ncbi:hypothetical protein Efla_006932 [Eimeria flavescens]
MEAPPTWFDFSTDCIYTAQKHKKLKAWRDGFCTCTFVRGWVVLKLYHEGASASSEPLEEWRIPPDTPQAVSQQEIEFQTHLVQLSGCPCPLDLTRRPQGHPLTTQPQTFPCPPPAKPGRAGEGAVVPKRRLPVGLFLPVGVCPPGLCKPARALNQNVQQKHRAVRGSDVTSMLQLNRQAFTAVRAAFAPPLLRVEEEPPRGLQPLPFWRTQGCLHSIKRNAATPSRASGRQSFVRTSATHNQLELRCYKEDTN